MPCLMGLEVVGWGRESPQVSPGVGRADLEGERVIQAEDAAAPRGGGTWLIPLTRTSLVLATEVLRAKALHPGPA